MILGVIPKIGALTTIIPSAVLGGAMVSDVRNGHCVWY